MPVSRVPMKSATPATATALATSLLAGRFEGCDRRGGFSTPAVNRALAARGTAYGNRAHSQGM